MPLPVEACAGSTRVKLAQMREQSEVRVPEDDWTGITSSKERRKLQNRLNQRIYRKIPRKRRGLKPKANKSRTKIIDNKSALNENEPLCTVSLQRGNQQEDAPGNVSNDPSSSPELPPSQRWFTGYRSRFRSRDYLLDLVNKIELMASWDYMLGSPRVDLLLTLIQFNVFRALLKNTISIGWSLDWLECDDMASPWNSTLEDNPPCPEALQPTLVQRSIKHHPWIDLWPIPKMRDNILLAGDSYDEDQLCNDLVEFEDVSNDQTGLIVWGEPWDPSGWEMSEAFLWRWEWAVKGCVELVESTNYWRERRGEKALLIKV
ncbi:hypothetical protein G7Y89_g2270 [Cudoniella acicularis]|uniref:BZIP domain-containing protein n=1 Tax=Cudoniella acicularis TaxID=354080 RepID=A0A8H4W6N5_9HELO|nr:hypothetical protein G7Y89_g2270 [Cudoniella acicularis]